MRLTKRLLGGAIAVAGLLSTGLVGTPGVASASGNATPAVPHYNHIVEIMMENTSYETIIGNSNAPQINTLAAQYGLATNYYGVTHPSEPNYMTNIAGDYFGVQDDNQYYCTPALASTDPLCAGTTVDHTVNAPTLADQLTAAGMTWKGYFQNLPPYDPTNPTNSGPYTFKWPSWSNALYASKHNPFVNFTGTQGARAQMVDDSQLATDLSSPELPNFSLVVPDQCHDMHGTGTCSNTDSLIQAGDTYVANTVAAITASPQWKHGNNAVVITWDEDDFSDAGQTGTGCCGADPGGGHVATIVITNKSTHPVTDNTAYNHYSLLRTFEDAFAVPHLAHASDSVVPPMTPLFTVSQDQQ